MIDTNISQQHIYAINWQADCAIRNELAFEMHSNIARLEPFEQNEFLVAVEEEAVRKAFIKLFDESPYNYSNALKVPVFDFKSIL